MSDMAIIRKELKNLKAKVESVANNMISVSSVLSKDTIPRYCLNLQLNLFQLS